MTIQTITTWTSFPPKEEIDLMVAKAVDLKSLGVTDAVMPVCTPNSGGFMSNTPPMVARRLWISLEAAQNWVTFLTENTSAGSSSTTEIVDE